MKKATSSIRVGEPTRWALKIAGAKLNCSIVELLARVERGDRAALRAWMLAAQEVAKK